MYIRNDHLTEFNFFSLPSTSSSHHLAPFASVFRSTPGLFVFILDPSAGNHVQPCLRLPCHAGDTPALDVPPWVATSPKFSVVKPAGLILLDGLFEMCIILVKKPTCGIKNQAPTKGNDFKC